MPAKKELQAKTIGTGFASLKDRCDWELGLGRPGK